MSDRKPRYAIWERFRMLWNLWSYGGGYSKERKIYEKKVQKLAAERTKRLVFETAKPRPVYSIANTKWTVFWAMVVSTAPFVILSHPIESYKRNNRLQRDLKQFRAQLETQDSLYSNKKLVNPGRVLE
ncbi:uncharacterized protein LOC141856993 [Brevipalpus obovatus]|uniref:uncharacterized protein LOC141856993 n=1 Tax=Brevipalpus obovatus TaxID=246614 RepID=UPI003D9E8391